MDTGEVVALIEGKNHKAAMPPFKQKILVSLH